MTRKEAVAFVATWQPILCPEWTVTIEDGPSPHWSANEHLAATNPAGGGNYLRATIHLHEITSGNLDASEERQTLLHELLHLTINDLELAAKEPANALSHDACRLARETIDRYVERTVDRLATAFEASST